MNSADKSRLPQQAPQPLLSVKEVAERLGCSPANVYALVERGELAVIRTGRSKGYRIDPADLEEFIRQRKVQYETPDGVVRRPRLKHLDL